MQIDDHIESYARHIDPGAWSLNGTAKRRLAARKQARSDVEDNEYWAGVGARRADRASQWEHIARVLAFDFLRLEQRSFDVIVARECDKYIKGDRK